MQSVVNKQYKYIMFYSAKAGCTSLRTLFLALHAHQLGNEQAARLNGYHNLNEVFPYVLEENYSNYFKFYISRNPYARIVSAFLDQYVYVQNEGVQKMLHDSPPATAQPQTFIEFLQYLKTVPDGVRDSHFQTQAYFKYDEVIAQKRTVFRRKGAARALDYYGDISDFNQHMQKVYRAVFRHDQGMLAKALQEIDNVPKLNSSFYGNEHYEHAAFMGIQDLDKLVYAPKPQDFFLLEQARELVYEIYADDFRTFGYDKNSVPIKKTSPELESIPDDFDWQTYLLLSPDLVLSGVNKEREVMRHYLEFGRFETTTRSYKIEAPSGFDWRKYIAAHKDLRDAGIDNERDAIIHYLAYGRNEARSLQA